MTDTQYDVEEQTSIANDPATRRSFLKNSALSALAVGALAACKGSTAAAASTVKQNGTGATADASGGSMAAHPAPVSAASAAEEMDRMHEAGIKAFPAKTAGKGNEVLAPRLEGDVRVYELTCRKVQWEVSPGKKVEAWTFNGVVPAPGMVAGGRDRCRTHPRTMTGR